MLIEVFSQKQLLESLSSFENDILIDNFLVISLGLVLLKNTINFHNCNLKRKVIVNCGDSLAYCISAIENNFLYIVFYCNDVSIINNIKQLAKSNNIHIFTSKAELVI